MKLLSFTLGFNLLILLLSCQEPFPAHVKRPDVENIRKEKEKYITMDIQPFSDIAKKDINHVCSELKQLFPNIELKESIALPQSAFYAKRNRFRADSLIGFLDKRTAERHVTIGLTTKDISTTKDKIADWGVMGLGFCPGKACVVSTFRLSKNNLPDQLFKTVIHELGHTQGLEHCPVKSCFMRDAEGGNPTDEEHEFCNNCKKILIGKGWNIK